MALCLSPGCLLQRACSKHDMHPLQVVDTLQRLLADREVELSVTQLSMAKWKRTAAHQNLKLVSAQEDLQQANLQAQMLCLEAEAQGKRWAELRRELEGACVQLQQRLTGSKQQEAKLKVTTREAVAHSSSSDSQKFMKG